MDMLRRSRYVSSLYFIHTNIRLNFIYIYVVLATA